MTRAAMQTQPERPALSAEQEAMVTAIAQIFERLIPKAAPPQIAAPKPGTIFITAAEAAERLGLSEVLIKRLHREGKLKGVWDRGGSSRAGNGVLKMRRADVEGLEL